MKKDIREIKEILQDIKTINLYEKYMKLIGSGKEISVSEIEDMKVFANVKNAYRLEKEKGTNTVEKIKNEAIRYREDYINQLQRKIDNLQNGLGLNFANRCRKNIEMGDLEQLEIELNRKEERIREKIEETALIEAKKRAPLRTRLFGVKGEKYYPNLVVFKPTVKEDMEDIITTLGKVEEITEMSNLYEKYINLFKSGKEMHPLLIEDTDIYDIARDVYKGGEESISKFRELSEGRRNFYIESLQDQLANLNSRLGSNFTKEYMEGIQAGNIGEAKEKMIDMKEKVKTETIRKYSECTSDNERELFEREKRKHHINILLHGIQIERVQKMDKEDNSKRKTFNMKKIEIDTPEIKNNENNLTVPEERI